MTTYTTTAIATNSVTNTVTVASISNMVPGLPITFSGVTFGGITTGSTYYIGTIIYGYPTSQITLNSLPGGAVFQLTTATGSMTAAWSSGGQQILVTTPPGENLNTAFTKINTNFDQIWAAGPVNSNIRITENTIYTLNTNGDLILNPNGIGNVVANAHVVPDTTLIRNLGSPTKIWNQLYVNELSVANLVPDGITIPVGNLHILGGNANTFLKTDGAGNLSWSLPVAAAGGNDTQVQYNNNGVLDGSDAFTFISNTSTVTIQNVTTTGIANLNYVGNVQIAGGVPGYVLQTDGEGNLSWTAPTGNITSILDQQIFGDGNTVDFTLITPSVTNAVLVSINGVMQIPGVAYTVASDLITFAEAPLSTDLVDIRFLVFGATPDNHPGGADGMIQFNQGGVFGGSGNLRYYANTGNLYSSNVSVSGNITASNYYGDGSHLTGITAVANTGNITFANNVISTNNANAALNISTPQQTPVSMAAGGNSATAQMLWATNIGALTPADLNNGILNGNTWGSQISAGNTGVTIASNSVVGLRTWTFGTDGTLNSTGGVIAGSISSTGAVIAAGNVSATGNVAGNYILGNVAFATGISQLYGDSNVYALLNGSAANIIPLANVSYSLGNATNQWKDIWVSNSTIYMNSVPVTLTAGNVLTVAGNSVVTTTSGSTSLGNIGFNGDAIYDLNGIYLENADLTHGATAALILPANGNTDPIQLNNIYGNVWIQSGADHVVTATWKFDNDGNLRLPGGGLIGNTYGDNPNAAGLQAGPGGYAGINSYDQGQFVQADGTGVYIGTDFTGNSCIWTFDAGGNLTLPNFPDVSINYANGDPYGGTGGSSYGNSNVVSLLAAFGSNTIVTTGTANLGAINISQSITWDAGGSQIYEDTALVLQGSVSVGITSPNTTTITSGTNYLTVDAVTGLTYNGNPIGEVHTGNITFDNTTLVGPSFGNVPSANSSVYIQPTIDSANVFQFGVDGNITATGNLGLVTNSNLWTFDTNGTLTLPGNTLQLGLIGGNSGLNSINDANITVNASGNVWNFDNTGKLTLPAQNVSGPAGESQLLTGSRRIINGVYTGATNPYAVELNIGPTPTVAYTASSDVYSVKVTFAVQGTGVGFNWEQFDVVATWSQDVPGSVNFVVSNRVKASSTIPDTEVTATINGTNQIEISLALTSGQNGWASFDAVEFGLMVD